MDTKNEFNEKPVFTLLEDFSEKTKSSIRKEHQLQRLGDAKPVCCICGYSTPEGLVKADRSLLEEHHPAALHVGPTVSLCRNCHAEQSELQRNWPKAMKEHNRSPLAILAAFLRGLCEFLISMAEHLLCWASWLLQLDKLIPTEVWETCSTAPITGGR